MYIVSEKVPFNQFKGKSLRDSEKLYNICNIYIYIYSLFVCIHISTIISTKPIIIDQLRNLTD